MYKFIWSKWIYECPFWNSLNFFCTLLLFLLILIHYTVYSQTLFHCDVFPSRFYLFFLYLWDDLLIFLNMQRVFCSYFVLGFPLNFFSRVLFIFLFKYFGFCVIFFLFICSTRIVLFYVRSQFHPLCVWMILHVSRLLYFLLSL